VGDRGAPVAIAKVANARVAGADAIEQGSDLLTWLHARCETRGGVLRGSIPVSVELVRAGSVVASVWAPARGLRLQDLSMASGYFVARERVRRHLELVASWLIAVRAPLAHLATSRTIPEVPRSWRLGPARTDDAPATPVDGTAWVQHGD